MFNYTAEKQRMTYNELELLVIEWSEKRKIIPNGKVTGQLDKLTEEVIEIIEANRAGERIEMQKEIGDAVVVLINICALMDFTLVDCLKLAYEKIKDRKGYTDENGIFHKEA